MHRRVRKGAGALSQAGLGVNPFLLSVVNAQKYEYHFYCKGGSILRASGEDGLKYPSLRNVMRIVNDVVSESFRGLRTSVKLGVCGEPQIGMSLDDCEH